MEYKKKKEGDHLAQLIDLTDVKTEAELTKIPFTLRDRIHFKVSQAKKGILTSRVELTLGIQKSH